MTRDENLLVLVDDDEDQVLIVQTYLEKLNFSYALKPFSSGALFLDYLGQVKKGVEAAPRTVLLDLHMPLLSGFEVLEKVRRDQDFCDLHIILFSNSNDEGDIKKAKDLGANRYQVKPTGGTGYREFFKSL